MSRDRGTQNQKRDFGYGLVCTDDGQPIHGCVFDSANQEHGILRFDGDSIAITSRFPIGTRLRIFPNHACATGAQHPEYHDILQSGAVETWPRFYGW